MHQPLPAVVAERLGECRVRGREEPLVAEALMAPALEQLAHRPPPEEVLAAVEAQDRAGAELVIVRPAHAGGRQRGALPCLGDLVEVGDLDGVDVSADLLGHYRLLCAPSRTGLSCTVRRI